MTSQINNLFEIKAPNKLVSPFGYPSIFLAGSIEMGVAGNWQEKIVTDLKKYFVTIYNPRRDNWNNSWKQDINEPKFYEQVSWELKALEKADIIAMYFDPKTKSPISLLELGLYAKYDNTKLIVCCPDGFWRKGNVQIVCQRYDVPLHNNYDTWLLNIKDKVHLI